MGVYTRTLRFSSTRDLLCRWTRLGTASSSAEKLLSIAWYDLLSLWPNSICYGTLIDTLDQRINIGALIYLFSTYLAKLKSFFFVRFFLQSLNAIISFAFVFLEFFRIKTEDDDLYEVVMKALETLRGDEDQDVRYFAGAKSFEEVSLFSDDAIKNEEHSSEEFDDENHNERVESEEKGALTSKTEDDVLKLASNTTDDEHTKVDESSEMNDEELESELENAREELQSVALACENEVADERSDREESSVVVVEDMLNSLIDTIETK